MSDEPNLSENVAPAPEEAPPIISILEGEAELRSVLRKSIDVLAVAHIAARALADSEDNDKRRVGAICEILEKSLQPIRSHLATIDADDELSRACLDRLRQQYDGLSHADREKIERLWVLSGVTSRMVYGMRTQAEANSEDAPVDVTPPTPLTPEEREANKQLVVLEAFAGITHLSGRPWRHLIDVSSVCNLRCRTCYHSLNPDFIYYDYAPSRTGSVGAAMPFAENVNISGTGEPLLSSSTPEIAKEYAELGAFVELTTNGTLGDKLEMVAPSLSAIHLSMDGAEKSTFEAIRFGANFEKVCDAIRKLPPESVRKVNINCVVSRPNAHEGRKLIELGLSLGAGSVTFQEFYAYLPWHDEMRLRPQDRRSFFESLENYEQPEGSNLVVINHIARKGDDAPAKGGLEPEASLEAVNQVPALPKAYSLSWSELAGTLERMAPPALEFIHLLVELTPEAKIEILPDATTDRQRLVAMIQSKIEDGTARSPSCLAPFNLLYVQGDGEIRPCCVLRTQVGSLRGKTFDAAWNDPAFVSFRDTIQGKRAAHPACNGCRDGGRFFGIEDALKVLDNEGLDVSQIARPEGAELPESVSNLPLVKLWGSKARAHAISATEDAIDTP
ncbi:MAG TPA: radical SAM/SPASM domain-containing protein [Myxococcales bacterium]|nr:radical SAM/SPASM domain-containing protein [Myxococcales bacterium]